MRRTAPAARTAAREYVLAHHSVDRLLHDIDELYRELLPPVAGAGMISDPALLALVVFVAGRGHVRGRRSGRPRRSPCASASSTTPATASCTPIPMARAGGIAVYVSFILVVAVGYAMTPHLQELPWIGSVLPTSSLVLGDAYKVSGKLWAIVVGLQPGFCRRARGRRLERAFPGVGQAGRPAPGRGRPHRRGRDDLVPALPVDERGGHGPVAGRHDQRLQPPRQHGRPLRGRRLRGRASSSSSTPGRSTRSSSA